MKKYFSKKTGEEIKFGDVVEFGTSVQDKDSFQKTSIKATFFPAIAEDLAKLGFIVIKDVKDGDENPKKQVKKEQPNTSEVFDQQLFQSFYNEYKALQKRVQALEDKIKTYDQLFYNITNHSAPVK